MSLVWFDKSGNKLVIGFTTFLIADFSLEEIGLGFSDSIARDKAASVFSFAGRSIF
jgi:hypothetical protein